MITCKVKEDNSFGNITQSTNIMSLDITHRPVFYLKHIPVCISKYNVSATGCLLSPEIVTKSVVSAQLSRFYLKTETIHSPKRCGLKYKQDGVLDRNGAMHNVHRHNVCTRINVASSQTFRFYNT
jgi:hypothetical protein